MKKLVLLFVVLTAMTLKVSATKHTITTSGFAFSPALLSVHIGDTVTIAGSLSHPLLQVSKATWDASGATALAGGFGPSTTNVTITISKTDTIYFICTAHVSFGMKGRIVVAHGAGINDIPIQNLTVSLYPNPVTATATIKMSQAGPNPLSVNVFSINGQLEKDLSKSVTSVDGDLYVQFDASTMPAGNHFVMVTDGKSRIVKKFEVIR